MNSQKNRRKDVSVEHKETFREFPLESKDASYKALRERQRESTHVQILLLCDCQSMIVSEI